jgi:hypothetical protein
MLKGPRRGLLALGGCRVGMDRRLVFAGRDHGLLELQAAFAAADSTVSTTSRPTRHGRMVPSGERLRLGSTSMTRRTGRPTAIFMLASLGSQVWAGAAAVQYKMPR